jgi:hypothetical protein
MLSAVTFSGEKGRGRKREAGKEAGNEEEREGRSAAGRNGKEVCDPEYGRERARCPGD